MPGTSTRAFIVAVVAVVIVVLIIIGRAALGPDGAFRAGIMITSTIRVPAGEDLVATLDTTGGNAGVGRRAG
ncbi:hypothetical protein PspLS_00342 [Pyricularia sp. CBS 133598]|nr:hypothetical protein PspLS_00342 [Pyricularia sp. CBS 133598]